MTGNSNELITQARLHDEYLKDDRPWVVAYSGGKDSTALLQQVYKLVLELGARASKPIHIIASDTKVEAPIVEDYLAASLSAIELHAREHAPSISVHHVQPEPDQTFWTNLIGRGYPPPTRSFRWCTTKIKIRPARRIIEDIAKRYGSVLLLLGTRSAESSSRSQRMEARETNDRGLNPHHEIPNALVFTPIAEWSNDEVWDYLFRNNPAPWGTRHDDMLELYRQANGGECPVVLDLNTPSCGGSRFGCWTCTVVRQDRSMQGFIATGDEWMRPLAEFRDTLKVWRERPEMRESKRRSGEIAPGPFTLAARQQILEALFQVESEVRRKLIDDEELQCIQYHWQREGDATQSALRLAKRYGRIVSEGGQFSMDNLNRELIAELASEYEIQEAWIEELLYLVDQKYPTLAQRGARPALNEDVRFVVEKAVQQEDIAAAP